MACGVEGSSSDEEIIEQVIFTELRTSILTVQKYRKIFHAKIL